MALPSPYNFVLTSSHPEMIFYINKYYLLVGLSVSESDTLPTQG